VRVIGRWKSDKTRLSSFRLQGWAGSRPAVTMLGRTVKRQNCDPCIVYILDCQNANPFTVRRQISPVIRLKIGCFVVYKPRKLLCMFLTIDLKISTAVALWSRRWTSPNKLGFESHCVPLWVVDGVRKIIRPKLLQCIIRGALNRWASPRLPNEGGMDDVKRPKICSFY